MPDEDDRTREGRERFIRFLKLFEGIERSTAASILLSTKQIAATEKLTEVVNKLVEVVNESTKASSMLFEAITRDKDGAICAIDDLIMELQGSREDLRVFVKARGMSAIFGPLFDPARRRR